jgi:hypothetical protein
MVTDASGYGFFLRHIALISLSTPQRLSLDNHPMTTYAPGGAPMPTIQSAFQVLDRHYLEIRCGLLDLAAALDRVTRSDGSSALSTDPRLDLIRQGIRILGSDGADRAERVQLLFSDQYQEGWNRKPG